MITSDGLEMAAAVIALMLAEESVCSTTLATPTFRIGGLSAIMTLDECARSLSTARKPVALDVSLCNDLISLALRGLTSATDLDFQSSVHKEFMSAWAPSLGLSADSPTSSDQGHEELLIETSHRRRLLPVKALVIWSRDYRMPTDLALGLMDSDQNSGVGRVRVSRSAGWSLDLG